MKHEANTEAEAGGITELNQFGQKGSTLNIARLSLAGQHVNRSSSGVPTTTANQYRNRRWLHQQTGTGKVKMGSKGRFCRLLTTSTVHFGRATVFQSKEDEFYGWERPGRLVKFLTKKMQSSGD